MASEREDSVSPTEVLSKAQVMLRRASGEPRFVPGTVLVGRYRVVGLLGRGGMGEVYRADDLKVREPVALKFLPEELGKDAGMLERFHHEVRIAHQISHPNVCRVYDISEAFGQHFISMEYIDGENLSSLLRRIGHLPPSKALEIAHQLCAGLAAAHACGVLHRDLKPGNVMIDGRGRAKITDFGLAGLADDFQGRESRAGTPAYMAPEQIVEQRVSVQSDIYSLGLVLFELFTGHRAFPKGDRPELLERGLEVKPRQASSLVEIDPEVERVLDRCLENDSLARPASVRDLAAALPGGDPLAAALLAGETPSPEMVAAAPKEGSLRPKVVLALTAALLFEVAAVLVLSRWGMLHRRVPLERPPEALADRAAELVRALGHGEALGDDAWGFREDPSVERYLAEHGTGIDRWAMLESGRPAAVYFWYRASPEPLVPVLHGFWRVDFDDPPLAPDMARVFLDPKGRLLAFQAVPRPDAASEAASEPDWSPLFAAAGLDRGDFTVAPSKRLPPFFADLRRAFVGRLPEHPEVEVRVEAAAWGGRPVSFEVLAPWSLGDPVAIALEPPSPPWARPIRYQPEPLRPERRAFQQLLVVLFFALLGASLVLARYNLQIGRGDRKGAFRFASFLFVVSMASWVLWTSHVGLFLELLLFIEAAALALFRSTLFWILYVALEPFVRRRWPGRIVSWSRLLAGRLRDPLVGRDLLLGALVGVSLLLVVLAGATLPGLFGQPTDLVGFADAEALAGLSGVVRQLNEHVFFATLVGLAALFALLLLTMLLKHGVVAAAAFWLLLALFLNLAESGGPGTRVAWVVVPAVLVWALRRFGLLAVAAGIFSYLTLRYYPITTDLGAWYAESAVWALCAVLLPALYGAATSLAGQPILRRGLLEGRVG